ncbi:hypothetical protein AAG570_003190 [Ranatra chinensis]|uniref:Uncharacterized protein n=1 Tax=Ranatra chinensis TaxID=642074 RepID=A0ABD0YUI8_9HEMI
MSSKRRNMFYENKKQETTEINTCNLPPFCNCPEPKGLVEGDGVSFGRGPRGSAREAADPPPDSGTRHHPFRQLRLACSLHHVSHRTYLATSAYQYRRQTLRSPRLEPVIPQY